MLLIIDNILSYSYQKDALLSWTRMTSKVLIMTITLLINLVQQGQGGGERSESGRGREREE
jgi:hypothetical protein